MNKKTTNMLLIGGGLVAAYFLFIKPRMAGENGEGTSEFLGRRRVKRGGFRPTVARTGGAGDSRAGGYMCGGQYCAGACCAGICNNTGRPCSEFIRRQRR